MKYNYTPAGSSKISSKLTYLQGVCDTPIARFTGCLSSLRTVVVVVVVVVLTVTRVIKSVVTGPAPVTRYGSSTPLTTAV